MTPKEALARAKTHSAPTPERIVLYRQVAEDPKAKAGERAEALSRGLQLEARAHEGPLPPALLQRAHEAIDALKGRAKAKLWPMVNAFFERLGEEDQEDQAIALFFAYLPLERAKRMRAPRAAQMVPRFFLHPRVQALAHPKAPRWMRGAPLEGAILPLRRIGSPYGIPRRTNSAKLGGLPALADPADWPRDAQGRPMHHLAQLASVHTRGPHWPALGRGLYQFFVAQQALDDLGGPCAVRFQPYLTDYADVSAVQRELIEAFGGPAVRRPSCYFDHEGIQAMGPYDHRFDARVSATAAQKAAWQSAVFPSGAQAQIGGHPYLPTQRDPRSGAPELDMLLLQLCTDERYGLSFGEGAVAWFFGEGEAVRRGDLSGVRFMGAAP